MSALEKLYFFVTENLEQSKDYKKVNEAYDRVYEKISNLLPEEKQLLEDLFLQTGGLESEYGQTCFKEGFRFAFKLAAECFN